MVVGVLILRVVGALILGLVVGVCVLAWRASSGTTVSASKAAAGDRPAA